MKLTAKEKRLKILDALKEHGLDDSMLVQYVKTMRFNKFSRIYQNPKRRTVLVKKLLSLDDDNVRKIKDIEFLNVYHQVTLIFRYLLVANKLRECIGEFDVHRDGYEPFEDFKWCITTINIGGTLRMCIEHLRKHSEYEIDCILIPQRFKEVYGVEEFEGVSVRYVDVQQPRKLGMRRLWPVDEEHAILMGYGLTEYPRCVIDSDLFVLEGIDEYVVKEPFYCNDYYGSFFLKIKDHDSSWHWANSMPDDKYLFLDDDRPYLHLRKFYKSNKNFFKGYETVDKFNYELFLDRIPDYEKYYKKDECDYHMVERFERVKKMRE
jgi:hypothetical protein